MRRYTLPIAALLGLGMLLGACSTGSKIPGLRELGELSGLTPGDEERISGVLDAVYRGMEQRNLKKVLAHVSPDYQDQEGRDYAGLEEYLKSMFKDYRDIRVTRVAPQIVVQGDAARAVETFGTVAEPENPNENVPINMQGQVTVRLEKAEGKWRIVEWGRML